VALGKLNDSDWSRHCNVTTKAGIFTRIVTDMEVDDLLLSLFGCLVAGTILFRILIVYHRTGIFPIVRQAGDTAHNFIQRVNPAIFALMGISILFYATSGSYYAYLAPIPYLEAPALQTAGIIIAYVSLIWSAVAQAQLGSSWRIGIDAEHDTALVTNGLYSRWRHPTYLGFMLMAIGLFFAMPNAVSLVACSLAVVVLPIEARLEEEYLVARHGDTYRAYLNRTRRWV
jgi:protein-S-isoprenylcysteine O-methyltransferase Ste14